MDQLQQDVMARYRLFEDGKLRDTQVVQLFQSIIDNGMMWFLSPEHQQMTMHFASKGHIRLPVKIQ